MPLPRVLEPELMDSPAEAEDYDAMDHRVVNQSFVADLLAVGPLGDEVLDLGTGTAQIPVELCRLEPDCRILAIDAALSMLELARYNVEAAGFAPRIQLQHVDAKAMPWKSGSFTTVMSNSIVHHIPEPLQVLAEAHRLAAPGGLLFFRDLLRPAEDSEVQRLVSAHAAEANEHQRAMFEASLRAALNLEEIRSLIASLGYPCESVQATSDRHWTWTARRS